MFLEFALINGSVTFLKQHLKKENDTNTNTFSDRPCLSVELLLLCKDCYRIYLSIVLTHKAQSAYRH